MKKKVSPLRSYRLSADPNCGKAPVRGNGLESGYFPIVGIGAAAGGLEAFVDFLKNTPPDSGMAFVIIQHLDQPARMSSRNFSSESLPWRSSRSRTA